jgi:hypothetical protein
MGYNQIKTLARPFKLMDHGPFKLMDHGGEVTMTCRRSPHHLGFVWMTSELRPDPFSINILYFELANPENYLFNLKIKCYTPEKKISILFVKQHFLSIILKFKYKMFIENGFRNSNDGRTSILI